jgi:hypothetical protein
MKKKGMLIFIAIFLFGFIATGVVLAADVCNFYVSGTDKLSAIASTNKNVATIRVKSYVGNERIAIYEVTVSGETFNEWNIDGNCILDPLGSTTITVRIKQGYGFQNSNVIVKAKTCP